MRKYSILVADDDEKILFAFQELLKKDGFKCFIAYDGLEAKILIEKHKPDIIFLDIRMPKEDGISLLRSMHLKDEGIPVIIMTGHGTMQTAIKAIQEGAFDYITKPIDVNKIRTIIRKALLAINQKGIILTTNTSFNTEILESYELIGQSAEMQEVFKLIGSISTTPNSTPALIIGESGTGKELVARAIHNNGEHSAEPFIAINCTAFPETLLESELFGYEKGAFTGATDRKLGKFELSKSGTIFLDEIGNLSLNLQQKLLRVIQYRRFERIGGNEIIPILARFVAATNVDITSEVRAGRFREDLFYRLNVASVNLTPLRERKDDIPLLANYFLYKYNNRLKKAIRGFSEETIELLLNYPFPGNVRELENIIERAVMLSKSDIIFADALNEYLTPMNSKSKLPQIPIKNNNFADSRNHILEIFEKEFLSNMLYKNKGNISHTANECGMTRQNLIRLMKKHKFDSKFFK
ncbi:MAG: sigma-54-dependent Fis family transcriptional regulator [Ignavibacteriales bacterium]|nr:MAG: sigma-54-dependent Fis family transcriptional regulator [Ignavibacteriales bacterium]